MMGTTNVALPKRFAGVNLATGTETGIHHNARQAWFEMWAYGERIGAASAELIDHPAMVEYADWAHAARGEVAGVPQDIVCAAVALPGMSGTSEWKWAEAGRAPSVRYHVPQPQRIGANAPPDLVPQVAEAKFETAVCGGRARFMIALVPEIRTVFWHAFAVRP